jgi:hypothetical protein
MDSVLQCPKCKTTLTETSVGRADFVPCTGCASPLQVEVFPAMFRRHAPGRDGEAVVLETEASCFYHPQKKAVLPCEGCGRFLCALCDCELHGQHFCPTCLETGKKKGKIKRLQNERVLYDELALALTIWGVVILLYPSLITAPVALYMSFRYWNSPLSVVRRTRWRFVVAIIFATLQIVGWGLGIWFFVKFGHHG